MEEFLNKLFDKYSEGYGVYDRETLIKDICKELQALQLQQTDVVGQSEQLPQNKLTDKEHKELMNILYPKRNNKSFRR